MDSSAASGTTNSALAPLSWNSGPGGDWRPTGMDIDLSVLRSLESEKDISLDTAIKAIEDALLMAYHKTEGASPAARVEVDRGTGHVTVWARETGAEGATAR